MWGGMARVSVGHLAAKFKCSGIEEFGRVISLNGEKEYLAQILALIKQGDTVWDVGANIGTHTVLFARAVGSAGQVYGFEPEPLMASKAESNVQLNAVSNAEILRVALGDHDGVARLNVDTTPGSGKHRFGRLEDADTLEVTISRGDSIIHAGRVTPPDVLKIDVEGHEFAVIAGLAETLAGSGCRVIACEVHPTALVEQGTPAELFEQALSDHGFKIQRIGSRGHEYHIICTR